jgi:hypothetical protein
MIYKPTPMSERFMFEHDESLRADLLPIKFPASYENGKLEDFLHWLMKNHEHKNFQFSMFPEGRYFFFPFEKRGALLKWLCFRTVNVCTQVFGKTQYLWGLCKKTKNDAQIVTFEHQIFSLYMGQKYIFFLKTCVQDIINGALVGVLVG